MEINISILADRYQIIDLLGEGGSGKTYRALDNRTQAEVAIKVLSLRGVRDWKTVELFEREAKIFAQLAHPNIPRYLDYFQTIVADEESFCLVQEIAPGKSLTDWVEEGYIFDELELRQIATQILEILIYLQTFNPPIIHRDLNPNNILRSESGIISLVDFGAVRDTYHLTITGGSTIVGTYGYMAPEQFRGQAVLGTDLYGLGTTLLYLKSGQDPANLPVKQMKIDFRDRVTVSDEFASWLDRLLEPIPEDRYQNAALALDYLNGKAVTKSPRPKYPIAYISRQDNNLKIVIPPIWFATRSSKQSFVAIAILSLLGIFSCWVMLSTVVPAWLWIFFLVTAIFTIGVTSSIKQTLMITTLCSLSIVIHTLYMVIEYPHMSTHVMLLPFVPILRFNNNYASTHVMLLPFVPILMFAIPICRILWHYCSVIMCQREIEIIDFLAVEIFDGRGSQPRFPRPIEIIDFSAVEISDGRGSQPRFPRLEVICMTKIAGSSIFTQTVAVEDIENINCRQVGVLNVKGGIRLEISQARHNARKNIRSAKKFYPIYIFGKYLDRAEQHWLMGEISEHLQYLDPLTDRVYPISSSSALK